MNRHLVLSPQPTQIRRADQDGPEFYPTPAWATKALIENESFEGEVWECACGDGAMSRVFEDHGHQVRSSDLFDRGFGEPGINFIDADCRAENIVTNPPYNLAEEFVHVASRLAERKFAFLLRLAFLEGARRRKTIFSVNPPAKIWVFSERITFYPKSVERKGSGTTAYAWFVWDTEHAGPTQINWLPTGYKKRG